MGGSTFVEMKNIYESLSLGGKAEIRRVSLPEEIIEVSAFYHLLPEGVHKSRLRQLARITYLLPWLSHEDGKPLGKTLFQNGIREERLHQIIRSPFPQDLVCLRRLAQRCTRENNNGVDWGELGKTLFYWNERGKHEILRSYFLAKFGDKIVPNEK